MLGQLDDSEIESLLHSEVIGRLACHAGGRTYVVPITYAYVDGTIYAHSAHGLKLQMMRENPNVCFQVDRIDDLTHWRSVIVWGRFEELSGPESDRAMAQLLGKMLPLAAAKHGDAQLTPKTLTQQYRARTQGVAAVAFCIRISERTGRFEG